MKRVDWLSWGLLAAMAGLSVVVWDRAPESLPIHWNLSGTANGHASRGFALSMLPSFGLLLWVLFTLVTKVIPIREDARVTQAAQTVLRGVLGLFTLLHGGMILSALGGEASVPRAALCGAGLLIVLIASVLRTLPPNRLIGVRLPATLADRETWVRTHRLGAWLFGGVGALTLLATLTPVGVQAGVLLGGLLVSAAVLTVFAIRVAAARA